MVRSLVTGFAAALALAAAISTADAQTVRHRQHYAAVHPGDIVVHARSYLDPGTVALPGEIGTGNRYVTDSAPGAFRELGPTFGNGAFDYMPSRFNPPGEPEPLFVF